MIFKPNADERSPDDRILRPVCGPLTPGPDIPLSADQTHTFGRDGTIQILSRRVSERHGELRFEQGAWVMRSGQMKNGSPSMVLVNDERVSERPLLDGDRIEIGGYRFLLLDFDTTHEADSENKLKLVLRKGPRPIDLSYEALPGESFIIGKSPSASWMLQSEHVSRHHARVEHNGREWIVRDLQSRNGTFVNGHGVEPELPIRHLDRMLIGEYDIAVKLDGQFGPPASV